MIVIINTHTGGVVGGSGGGGRGGWRGGGWSVIPARNMLKKQKNTAVSETIQLHYFSLRYVNRPKDQD